MWVAYRGQVTKASRLTGLRFSDKEGVLKILNIFPQSTDGENWVISDLSRDSWKHFKDDFFTEFNPKLSEIEKNQLQDQLPEVIANVVEQLPVGNEGEFPIIWRDLLGQLGYRVNPPGCLHRRIELIKMGRYTSSMTFKCIDCDKRLEDGSIGNTCRHCGGILDQIETKTIPVRHKKIEVGLMPSSVNIKEEKSSGTKFLSKCRNCSKESAYTIV